MRLENAFEVPASREQTWELLNDVTRVVPCMPGAELTEVVDDDTFKAKMHVKLGPIALQFATDVKRETADREAWKTTLSTKARELKGRGGASATIESSLEQAGTGTRVTIVTDLQMQGAVAQYGRGVVPDVANQLVTRFAQNLAAQLDQDDAAGDTPAVAPSPSAPAPVKPVGGIALVLRVLLARLRPRRRA
jgi:carbon monoxide dehydrogenase subunit G